MSYLRKEYKEYKLFKEEIFKEAAEAWTEENVILINERLNRNSIYRLNSAIERFDNKFGPYRDKLPAIADILSNAENGLHLVITGKVGSRTTAQMLQRMSIMYNILSNFFGGDLGALLKTPAFRISQNQPDEKIDKIADRGHDVKAIRRTLASALKPNNQERLLFRRAYKSFDMPTLDWNMAAKQLCCLSVNELQDLAGIERVPMVVIDEPHEDTNTSGETGLDERTASNTAAAVAGTVVGGGVVAAVGGGIAAGKALAGRFKGPTPQDIAEMNKYFKRIESTIPDGEETAKLKNGLKTLEANIKKAEGGAKFAGWNPLRNPTQRAISQGKQIIDIFEKLGQAWTAARGKYKDPLEDDDIANIEKMLLTQVNSVGQKLGRLFKTNLPSGLTAKDIVNALVSLAKKPTTEPDAPVPTIVNENYLDQIFSQMPNKKMLSESLIYQFEIFEEFEHFLNGSLLAEGFEDLDSLLVKFANIKTNIDDKFEKQEKETGSGQTASPVPPSTTQPQKQTSIDQTKNAEAEAAKETDIANEDIEGAINGSNIAMEAEIGKEKLEQLNKAIAALQIPQVTDVASAKTFLQTYKSLLTKDLEIGNLINILASNVPQNIQEHRNIAINIIKRIIMEQPSFGQMDAELRQNAAQNRELENKLNPKVQVRLASTANSPNTPTTTQQNSPAPAVPAEVTKQSIQDAGTDATAIAKNPQTAAVVNDRIEALEIPGITDVASVAKFITDYISVIGKMKEVKQLLALLKDVTNVKIYPKVNTTPATGASAASPVPKAPATPAQQPAAAAPPR
jgi:ACT domain-containing protein